MCEPTPGKLFRWQVDVFATLVLELKSLNAAQHALCDAEKQRDIGENSGARRRRQFGAMRIGSAD
jgi:hypothetical protein